MPKRTLSDTVEFLKRGRRGSQLPTEPTHYHTFPRLSPLAKSVLVQIRVHTLYPPETRVYADRLHTNFISTVMRVNRNFCSTIASYFSTLNFFISGNMCIAPRHCRCYSPNRPLFIILLHKKIEEPIIVPHRFFDFLFSLHRVTNLSISVDFSIHPFGNCTLDFLLYHAQKGKLAVKYFFFKGPRELAQPYINLFNPEHVTFQPNI